MHRTEHHDAVEGLFCTRSRSLTANARTLTRFFPGFRGASTDAEPAIDLETPNFGRL